MLLYICLAFTKIVTWPKFIKNLKMKLYICFLITLFFSIPYLNAQNSHSTYNIVLPDSVTVSASNQYGNASILRQFFVGSNYRKEWSEPVKMAVFNLTAKGMTITELGGGQQTKSLRLTDKNKKEWVLRTVDKTVDKALVGLQKVFAKPLVQDMISAAYPYAPLAVGYMAKATGIIAPNPVLYYVPDDPALGKYREIFAGKVCFLEEREPSINGGDTESTDNVLEEIIEQDDHLVLQKTVLKARLLDMLIADWDRHADQWRWGKIKSQGNTFYYAIPRDRDQAFFMANGFIPLFARYSFMQHISWFTKNSIGLKHLNYKTWTFDKTFLNALSATDWETAIKDFQHDLSDEVIHAAVKKMPKEIQGISGEEIAEKLISRRDGLLKNGMKYYSFISAIIQINGKEDKDYFEIDQKGKELLISVYELNKDGSRGLKYFERKFKPEETRSIYLVGYDDDDHFEIKENVDVPIKLKIYGNKGSDIYDLKGKIKSEVYDIKAENNKVKKRNNAEIDFK